MKKIPTIFLRNEQDRKHVTNQINPECQWVFDGKGIATIKYDGTCVIFDGDNWLARREIKAGGNVPDDFILVNYDEVTRKTIGWVPVETSSFYKYFLEAYDPEYPYRGEGTYELCGPKINGNPEGFTQHVLVPHGWDQVEVEDRSYEGIRNFLLNTLDKGHEGIVFWYGTKKAKIKRRDFV